MARDGRGRYFVIATNAGSPLVFDSTGRFLRTLGRKGQGPGEYQYASAVFALPGDSVLVFDRGRYSLHGPDLNYVRGAPIDRVYAVIPAKITRLPSGDIVSAGTSLTASGIGFPLHRLGRDGRSSPFGREARTSRTGLPEALRLYVGPGAIDNVWVGRQWPIDVALLDGTGATRRELSFGADWLPSGPPRVGDRRTTPPWPGLNHLREDGAGRLWVAINVPGERWREGWGEPRREGRAVLYSEPRWDYLYSTVISVVDWSRGTALASTRFPGHLLHFFEDGLFGEQLQDEDGVPFVDIWRVSLVGHTPDRSPARR